MPGVEYPGSIYPAQYAPISGPPPPVIEYEARLAINADLRIGIRSADGSQGSSEAGVATALATAHASPSDAIAERRHP
jgi:hypothetical protein